MTTSVNSNSPTYDPTTTATQLAQASTANAQTALDTQTKAAQSTSTALTSLQTALTAFDGSLITLSGTSPLAMSATFSNSAIGTATASATATAGTYSFFVKSLASANQVAYDATTVPGSAKTMAVTIGSTTFNVDLTTVASESGGLSARNIAAAINQAQNNTSLVTASTVTVGGVSQLVLTANTTGAANKISVSLDGSKTSLAGVQLAPAQDAVVDLGGENSGVELTQSSNTFTAVDGVSMTFTQAMASGSAPVTLTVGRNDSKTAANLQSFVDAYNKLKGVLDGLTAPGDSTKNVAAGAFAEDSGVRALEDRLASILRENVGGVSLISYGISAQSDGTLSLNQTKLTAKLNTNPSGLGQLFGSAMIGTKGGVLGDLDTYLNTWTNAATGQISQRQNAVSKLQASYATRQTELDTQYNNAYQRYLAQFTALQALQQQMSQTTNMFDAMFGSSN